MINNSSVLIVARPNRIRDGLRALLRAMPQLEIIGQVDDGSTALKIVTDHPPALMLLDSNLPDNQVQSVLKRTKAKWPQTRCIVVADNVKQEQIAKAHGADAVLIAGFPAAKLFNAIEKLLSNHETPV